jgi:hypothetical protein
MDNLLSSLPTHLDFTTLYASALALSSDDRKRDGLPLSRLLALSQLIESIVLHESLQYELGDTPDWTLYREKLEKSIIPRLAPEFGVPLLQASAQVDSDESSLLIAMKDAATAVRSIPLEALNWAVQLRGGTYAAVHEVSDTNNPFTRRYLELAHSNADPEFQKTLKASVNLLNDNHIGILGFHVMVRLLLHESYWVSSGRAHYYPHFSRQPLLAVLGNAALPLEKWTMSELEMARHKILKQVSNDEPSEFLDRSLSPIFLACLARAKAPEDLFDEANRLRNSEAAVEYRKERDQVLAGMDSGDTETQMHYKTRISLRLRDLRDVLFERGSDQVYERQSVFRFLPGFIPGWTFAMKKSQRVPRFPGDRATIFIGDVILQSLGVTRASEKIREVFGAPIIYDTPVLGF